MKNNIKDYLKTSQGGDNNMSFCVCSTKIDEKSLLKTTRFTSQNCLGNLLGESSDTYIYLKLFKNNFALHTDFKDAKSFTEWWLSYIKNAVASNFSANIVCVDDSGNVYIEIPPNVTSVCKFANYELIRYLAGHYYGYIPGLIYELDTKFNELFPDKLELLNFAYFCYSNCLLTSFNRPNTNYMWHYLGNLNIFSNGGSLCIPYNASPDNYTKVTNVYGSLNTSTISLQMKNINRLQREELCKLDNTKLNKYLSEFNNFKKLDISNPFELKKVLNIYRNILNNNKLTLKELLEMVNAKEEVIKTDETMEKPQLQRVKRKYVRKTQIA